MLFRLPFPVAVSVKSPGHAVWGKWTMLSCHLTKSKVYQTLLSQMLKSVFKYPEDGVIFFLVCAPEMVIVFVEIIRYQSSEATWQGFSFTQTLWDTSLECVQLDIEWCVLLVKVWTKIFLILDSTNMLLLLDVAMTGLVGTTNTAGQGVQVLHGGMGLVIYVSESCCSLGTFWKIKTC